MSDSSLSLSLKLLGLPLAEARGVLAGLGREAVLLEGRPPRPRRPFPEDMGAWRVARVRERSDGAVELVVVPPIELTPEAASDGADPS